MFTHDHLDAIDLVLQSQMDQKIKIIMYEDLIKPENVEGDTSFSYDADED